MINNAHPSNQPEKSRLHWPALIQMILSLLGSFILIGGAAAVAITAIIKSSSSAPAAQDPTQSFMVAASLAFAGILLLPSAWYAWRFIAYPDKEPATRPEWRGFGLVLTLVVVILVSGALYLGFWSSENNRLTWLLLPPLNIIATGLPALWVVYLGTRGLIPGAPRRRWGVLASGLVLGPFIILILELILLVFVGILAILWIMLNPSLSNQLYSSLLRLRNAGPNIDSALRIMLPYLLNPGILVLVFTFISLLVPMIEEALKPIGVWLFGRKLSPAQGFGYGVLSGAGFGLFENLGNTSGGATGWALLASTRISTLFLHSFTAGLMGWALASAFSERRYLRLLLTYGIAVCIHGLWNGLALLSTASSLQGFTSTTIPVSVQQLGVFAGYGIIVLGVSVFLLFLTFNAILQRRLPKPSATTPDITLVSTPPTGIPPTSASQAPSSPAESPSTPPPSEVPFQTPQAHTPDAASEENPAHPTEYSS